METFKKLWKGLINWKRWKSIKSWKIWKLYKKKIFWEILLIITLITFLLVSILLLILNFQLIANFFFTSNDRNGELIKVLLSVFGGIGLFYGLFINSRRIQEQTRQNNISESSNADSRFGVAIGYLGNENTSIVLGGLYALHQLAKEDKRYRSIVAEIYTKFLEEKSVKLYEESEVCDEITKQRKVPVIVESIVDLLFDIDSTFIGLNLQFSSVKFENLTINGDLEFCTFDNCEFVSCKINSNIKSCKFNNCTFYNSFGMSNSSDKVIEDCFFFSCRILDSLIVYKKINRTLIGFFQMESVRISAREIVNCIIYASQLPGELTFLYVNSFKGTKIRSKKEYLVFQECDNVDEIELSDDKLAK